MEYVAGVESEAVVVASMVSSMHSQTPWRPVLRAGPVAWCWCRQRAGSHACGAR